VAQVGGRGFAELVTNCVLLEPGMRGCTVENWVLLDPLLSAFGLMLVLRALKHYWDL